MKAILTLTIPLCLLGLSAAAEQPNIIVIYTDDHGWPDIGVAGINKDLKTPHLDRMAKAGVYASSGYSTAPQCVPSRAGLLVGKSQSRFGVEANGASLDGFDAELTIAERLKKAGYATGQIGKWHLGPTNRITEHGFDDVYAKSVNRPCHANYTLAGKSTPMQMVDDKLYHLDACSEAARVFIERHKEEPFFLYLAYRAPHVPLDAPEKYLSRFPGQMPERRRQALAMISAMDDGVGLIRKTLRDHDLHKRTLVFYIGDNGAPLKIHKLDAPGGGPGWDGSLNKPMNGEKGMLSEGGMRVPFVVEWPETIPGGQIYDHPVITLDVAATALSLAGLPEEESLDGVNLVPYLSGKKSGAPHQSLQWRWIAQAAIREGDWKFLKGGAREYLFNLKKDREELSNQLAAEPAIAARLRRKLAAWSQELNPPGLASRGMSKTWEQYYDFYLDGKPAPPRPSKKAAPLPTERGQAPEAMQGWIARNAVLAVRDGALRVKSNKSGQKPFLAQAGLKLKGPLTARLEYESTSAGQLGIAWRLKGEKDFCKNGHATVDIPAAPGWREEEIAIPPSESIIHLRILLPPGEFAVRRITLRDAAGQTARDWNFAGAEKKPVTHSSKKPNVLFILADDLGWADTTLYGHTRLYETPNIERLAKRGMTFTRAYSASPLCSPTRASILTGLSPARTGLTTPNCHLPQVTLQATKGTKAPGNKKSIGPASVSRLDPKYYTLGEALKDAGYATGHFGKWHLGREPYSPLEHGFDLDVPHWPGPGPAGSFVAPWKFPDFDPDTPNEHIEDRMAKEAVKFLEAHKDEPFFLNYWMFSVHAPFDAKKKLIEKYRSRIDPSDAQRSPTYAAMVESMDDAVGTLLDTLERLGLAENTIVIFFSDNGGNMYNTVDGTTPTSNAPLRGGKASMYEGGIRVPLIVSWPGMVQADSRNDSRVQSDDFYPTILDLLGRNPQAGQVFDGVSFLPALRGKPHQRGPSFTYFPHDPPVPDWVPPSVAVHEGDWKLIRIFHGGEDGAHRWKLFNLKLDIGEQNDLAANEPARVEMMDALIENFLNDTKAVRPVPNPKFNPAVYRPEDEGKGRIRTKPKAKPKPKSKPEKVPSPTAR